MGGREGGREGGEGGFLELDLEANLKAHRPPGVEHDGVPDDYAYWPAMPCEMHYRGPQWTLPSPLARR